MKLNSEEFFNKVGFEKSVLRKYLGYNKWYLLDGLLLLVGLSPEETIVSNSRDTDDETQIVKNFSSFKNHSLNELPKFYLNNLQPLDEHRNFSIYLGEYIKTHSYRIPLETLSDMIGEDVTKDQLKDALEIIERAQEFYEKKFQDLIGIWFSSAQWDSKQDKYSVNVFIEWAKKNKIEVPWLGWAKDKGLIETDKQLDPRREKSYLNVIGALLEVVTGPLQGGTFSSEKELRYFIAEKCDDLYGVRPRTTAAIFADAKRSLLHIPSSFPRRNMGV